MCFRITSLFLSLLFISRLVSAQDSLDNDYLLQLYQAGDYIEAAEYIERTAVDSNDTQMLNSLAYAYRMGGNLAAAEKHYRVLYQRDTLSLPTIMNLAGIYFNRGNIREAADLYQQALAIDSTNIKVYQRLSEVAIKRNETDAAYEYLNRANTLDPANASVAYNLAMVAISLQLYPKADTAILRALEYDPENLNLLYGKAVTKDYLRQYEEGIETCEQLMALGSDSLMVMPMAGAMHFYNKDYEKSIEIFTWLEKEITDLKEGDKYYLAMSYLRTQQYEAGFTYLDAAIEQSISPNTSRYYQEKGEVQQLISEHVAAVASYKRSLDFKKSALAYYQIALINDYYLKNETEALQYYRSFIKIHQDGEVAPDIKEFVEGRISEMTK